ncbi:hypothetical protein [Bacteriovorax sp. Seq25_V]|uniref:hypothetical protein n=1 Tax=Bacteriovorax sp. Seq25_V TaxID=1201288 RepID=UPI00038A4C98|nr:hypothetical protein [Bacteriovorax sp. Seq25_V]EQC47533.1 hypothetical protein M900_0585 [Bacteriovorax sp. Seq25_V]
MKRVLFVISLLASVSSFASISERNFCSQANMQLKLSKAKNRLSFTNRGGLFNAGVCWWHSRFTRNANYLAVFNPSKPALEDPTALIKKIRKGKEVVEIPGFSSLEQFSRYYEEEIQKVLESWQLIDGAVNQQWIVGLWGKSEVSPENMEKRMNKLYARVSQGEVVYQKLQIDGIDAHAWLVIDMAKTANGYKLLVVDSNYRSTDVYTFEKGDRSFEHPYYGKFVPYTGRMAEERRLKKTRAEFCNGL